MGLAYNVLEAVRNADSTINMDQLAADLNLERSALDGIIGFWIRKGKIIRVENSVCTSDRCSKCPAHCPARNGLVAIYQAEDNKPGD